MENYNIRIIRSSRKTLSLKIERDGSITIHAPYRCPNSEINQMLTEKRAWIEKHMQMIHEANAAASITPLSPTEIRAMAEEAMKDIPARVERYAKIMGVTYYRITIRNQKGRMGSCSSKGNLNFNCLLMLAPESVRDYVVVHELAHRKQMNHSPAFWAEVAAVLPDYQTEVKWLKENGTELIARMLSGQSAEW